MSEKLIIDERSRLQVSQVKEVSSFNEREIRLELSDGVKLSIIGERLKIASFSKEVGDLVVGGDFCELKYHKKKLPFFKRVLK